MCDTLTCNRACSGRWARRIDSLCRCTALICSQLNRGRWSANENATRRESSLLVAESDQRIDARGTVRGDPAREKSNRRKYQDHDRKRERVGGLDAYEEGPHHAGTGQRNQEA